MRTYTYIHTFLHQHIPAFRLFIIYPPRAVQRGKLFGHCKPNMLGGCRPEPNGPSTCPRCQQAPLALSTRLPPEREEMESQIGSDLITYSLRLQLRREWRVWGPCHLMDGPHELVNWNLIYLSPYLAHYQSYSRLGFILPSENKKKWKKLHLSLFYISPVRSLLQSCILQSYWFICELWTRSIIGSGKSWSQSTVWC